MKFSDLVKGQFFHIGGTVLYEKISVEKAAEIGSRYDDDWDEPDYREENFEADYSVYLENEFAPDDLFTAKPFSGGASLRREEE